MSDEAFSLDDDERHDVSVSGGGDTSAANACLTLVGSDGKPLSVMTREHLAWLTSLCGLIRTSLEGDTTCQELPFPSISSAALEDVLTFCYMRRGVPLDPLPSPITSADIHIECPDLASAAFIAQAGTPNQRLHALIYAANHLDCSSLVDLAVTHQACVMRSLGNIDAIRNSLRKQGAQR
jgi:hypothetical protein